MATLDKLQINNVVNFELYPSGLLGPTRIMVRVESVLNASTARALGYDVDSMHVNVYPTLPTGSVDDPDQYLFIRFKKNDNFEIIGLPWIKEETITLVTNNTLQIVIPNVNAADLEKVTNALSANGYTPSSVKFI